METLNMWITPALLLAALVFLWNLHREIIGLHREIADLRKDTAQQIADLRRDTAQQITDLRKDTAQHVTELHREIADLRKDIAALGTGLARLEGRFDGYARSQLSHSEAA